MANWSLKVNVNENAMDLTRQEGDGGGAESEMDQETVDSNPRCSPVTLTALPLPEPSSPGDFAFVCWGQQFSSTSTWAPALLALRLCKCLRWSGASSQDGAEVKKRGQKRASARYISAPYRREKETVLQFRSQVRTQPRARLMRSLAGTLSFVTLSLNWSDSWHWFIAFIMPRISFALHPCHSQNSFQVVWRENNG